ncbi:MAG: hypothetical protein ACLQNV_28105 [Steroidobacteraceae bacterium]
MNTDERDIDGEVGDFRSLGFLASVDFYLCHPSGMSFVHRLKQRPVIDLIEHPFFGIGRISRLQEVGDMAERDRTYRERPRVWVTAQIGHERAWNDVAARYDVLRKPILDGGLERREIVGDD